MKSRFFINSIVASIIVFGGLEINAQANFSALVIRVKGKTTLTRSGKTTKLKKNMLIKADDVIETKSAALIGLQFSNGISSQVGPNTKLSVKKLIKLKNQRQIHLNVAKGSLINRVKPGSEKIDMQVSTPTMIAAVRGTEFSVEASSSKETTVAVNNGSVAVSSSTGKVKNQTIQAGHKIIANTKGARKSILDSHDKQKFRILEQLESSKKSQFDAFTEQVERNNALRKNMRKSILNK